MGDAGGGDFTAGGTGGEVDDALERGAGGFVSGAVADLEIGEEIQPVGDAFWRLVGMVEGPVAAPVALSRTMQSPADRRMAISVAGATARPVPGESHHQAGTTRLGR